MSEKEKLLPCPFCGDTDVDIRPTSGCWLQAQCRACRAKSGEYTSYDNVIRHWNHRTDAPKSEEEFNK